MSNVNHLHVEADIRKLREHSDILSIQYLARCLEPENVVTQSPQETHIRHGWRSLYSTDTVVPMWLANYRKATLLIPFMLTCSMMRFIPLILVGLCHCGVSVVMWSSLVYLLGCRGILCGCDGCCDCDACTVICVACVYAERV